MDLGIAGKRAIVCASSRGLGKACAIALAQAGVSVVINGRDPAHLEMTAQEVRELTGADVTTAAADLDTPEGRDSLLRACPEPDILVNNNAGPPFRDFRTVDRDAMVEGLGMNMLAPIELIQRVIGPMTSRGFGRIVNITSIGTRMPLEGLELSSAARAGLTAFVAGVARTVADRNVTINNLLPGYFETDRLHAGVAAAAARTGLSAEAIEGRWRESVPAKRFGSPAELGQACAFLCSARAGYITGQNLLLDGGLFPGIF